MIYIKNIKLGALLGIIFSFISFLICLLYVILANLPNSLLAIIIIYAAAQIFVFMATLYLLFNSDSPPRLVFIIGIMGLFAFLAPGMIILLTYFRQQKSLIK